MAWLSAAAEARELVSLELGRSISRTAQEVVLQCLDHGVQWGQC